MPKKGKQKNEGKFEAFLRDILLTVVIVVWVISFSLDCLFNNYDMPWSVQTGLTMVMGFLLGEKALKALKKQ